MRRARQQLACCTIPKNPAPSLRTPNSDSSRIGHETGLAISYGAAGQGITSLERHITINRAMYGSDQAASIEPAGLRQLVGVVRKIEAALRGDGKKFILPAEQVVADKLRAHIKNS